jgi:hypothetical protein
MFSMDVSLELRASAPVHTSVRVKVRGRLEVVVAKKADAVPSSRRGRRQSDFIMWMTDGERGVRRRSYGPDESEQEIFHSPLVNPASVCTIGVRLVL